jgi:hypothetical protein
MTPTNASGLTPKACTSSVLCETFRKRLASNQREVGECRRWRKQPSGGGVWVCWETLYKNSTRLRDKTF